MAKTSRSKIESTAVNAAMRGAKILCSYYETGLKPQFKGEVNLVTKADLESQMAIVKTIQRAFPDHEILAEEEKLGHGRSLDGPIWVIDPLDGTTNFSHGFPMFAISIAYREGGETQFGLVYHPLLKEMFIAHKGKGTTMNGKKIKVSKVLKLTHSLLATGFPYNKRESEENNLKEFCYFELAAQFVRRAGAAVLDLANLSKGRFDGFWEPGLAPWDIAAGMLLVEEAGGKCTDYSGKPITNLWNGQIVASNNLIHDEILEGLARKMGHNPFVTEI